MVRLIFSVFFHPQFLSPPPALSHFSPLPISSPSTPPFFSPDCGMRYLPPNPEGCLPDCCWRGAHYHHAVARWIPLRSKKTSKTWMTGAFCFEIATQTWAMTHSAQVEGQSLNGEWRHISSINYMHTCTYSLGGHTRWEDPLIWKYSRYIVRLKQKQVNWLAIFFFGIWASVATRSGYSYLYCCFWPT